MQSEPIGREVLIEDRLAVHVFEQRFATPAGNVDTWVYLSAGLGRVGQKELMLVARRPEGAEAGEYPRELLEPYQQLFARAENKRFSDVGSCMPFQEGAPMNFGGNTFAGLLFTLPQRLPGRMIVPPHLLGVPLTAEEIEAARQFGVVRLMTHFARHHRFYPTTPWIEDNRPELPDDGNQSLLARTRRAHLRGAVAYLHGWVRGPQADGPVGLAGQRVVLQLHPQVRDALLQQTEGMEPGQPRVLFTDPDPRSHAALHPASGRKGLHSVGAGAQDTVRIAANFLLISVGEPQDRAGIAEDGLALALQAQTWERLRQAIAAGQPLRAEPDQGQGLGFELMWLHEAWNDPVRGLPLPPAGQEPSASGGIESVAGETQITDGLPGIGFSRFSGIQFITPESEVPHRLDRAALDAFTAKVAAAVENWTAHTASEGGADLALEYELRLDGRVDVTARYRPTPDEKNLERLKQQLVRLPPPKVTLGPVRFRLLFALWGGTGAKLD
ncbi:hypothetical protein ABI59_16125 [Acidobacteria bacterium Mor1]|nr:hypothetical protein ABI59_16125 [Acidobacteria bacterium Mor1]